MKLLVMLLVTAMPCQFQIQQHKAAEAAYADAKLALNVAVATCLRDAKTDEARITCQKSGPALYNKMLSAKTRADAARKALDTCLEEEKG